MTTATEPVPRALPKKRRRIWPFVVVAVVLVALIVGFFIADAAAKAYAQDQIKQKVVAALGIDPKTDVHVVVGGGSVLFQALSGKLSTVDVTVPKLAFGDLVGSATLHATEVPLNQNDIMSVPNDVAVARGVPRSLTPTISHRPPV